LHDLRDDVPHAGREGVATWCCGLKIPRLAYADITMFPYRHMLDATSATGVFLPFFRSWKPRQS